MQMEKCLFDKFESATFQLAEAINYSNRFSQKQTTSGLRSEDSFKQSLIGKVEMSNGSQTILKSKKKRKKSSSIEDKENFQPKQNQQNQQPNQQKKLEIKRYSETNNFELETLQQVKRLRLNSLDSSNNNSPQSQIATTKKRALTEISNKFESKTIKAYTNVLVSAAAAVTTTKTTTMTTSRFKSKMFKSIEVESVLINNDSCSIDSGLEHSNSSQPNSPISIIKNNKSKFKQTRRLVKEQLIENDFSDDDDDQSNSNDRDYFVSSKERDDDLDNEIIEINFDSDKESNFLNEEDNNDEEDQHQVECDSIVDMCESVQDDNDDDSFECKFNMNLLNGQMDNTLNQTISNRPNGKLLDISNCSMQSNNSVCNMQFQARRCLFKSSPIVDAKQETSTATMMMTPGQQVLLKSSPNVNSESSKKTKQITPISVYRHNSIITNNSSAEIVTNEDNLATLVSHFDQSIKSIEKSLEIYSKDEQNKSSQHNHHQQQRLEQHETIKESLEIECNGNETTKSSSSFWSSKLSWLNSEMELAAVDSENKRLIGDKSRYHILPCKTSIKHNDLNVITPQTLTQVLDGHYNNQFDRLIIIDSRYPYEYEGGHIRNAKNVYTKEKIVDLFLNKQHDLLGLDKSKDPSTQRVLIIFHCEFSSERGPSLLRFLRNQDRVMNRDSYPKLFYPELYLLEGGYKAFYELHSDYCQPKQYKPMLHQDHLEDLKHFRAKTKTWEQQNKYMASGCSSTNKFKSGISSRLQRFPRSNLF